MLDNQLSLWILSAVSAALIVRGLMTPAGALSFPFIAGATVAGWFVPQAIGLSHASSLPEGGFWLGMIFAAACLVAIYLGDLWAKRVPTRLGDEIYDRNKLLIGAGILSAAGNIAYSILLRTPATLTGEGLTTGIATILFFLSELQYFGLAIGLLLLLRRFSWVALVIVVVDLNFMLGFIVFGGRRGPALDLALIILCALWFQRRFVPPKTLIVVGMIVAALLGNSIGQYRSLVSSINQEAQYGGKVRLPTVGEFFSIDFLKEFNNTINIGSYEAKNEVMYVAAFEATKKFDFGLGYWNYFIFRYVPGQLVGFDFKRSLMVDLPNNPANAFGFYPHLGTTLTGFSDAFGAFWWFGALVFVGIAALMRRIWDRASLGGVGSQVIYCVTLSTAGESITHSTAWFAVYWPQVLIFVLPVFWFARQRSERAGARLASASPER